MDDEAARPDGTHEATESPPISIGGSSIDSMAVSSIAKEASNGFNDASRVEDDTRVRESTDGTRAHDAASLPSPAADGSIASGNGKTQNAQFVHKLFSMVQNPSLQNMISWSESGTSFYVFNPTEFARHVLPQFFKHNNFQSFVRQCNMYGFSKVNDTIGNVAAGTDGVAVWEFQHASFQRDRPDLLSKIKRKSSKGSSANSVGPVQVGSPPKRPTPTSSRSDTKPSRESRDKSSGAIEEDEATQRPSGLTAADASSGEVSGQATRLGHDCVSSESERESPRQKSPPPLPHAQPPMNIAPPAPVQAVSTYHLPSPTFAPHVDMRHSGALEGQVRALTEQLHQQHQETVQFRSSVLTVLQILTNVVEGLDADAQRKDEVARCQYLLNRLATDIPAEPRPPTAISSGPFSYSPFGPPQSSWHGIGGPLRSPRPSTSSSTPFFYTRPGPVESFARGGPFPRRESRDESSSPYTTTHSILPSTSMSDSTSTTITGYTSSRHDSAGSAGYGSGFAGRPMSSGVGPPPPLYIAPRPSWPGPSVPGRPSSAAGKPASPTTLPSISALFGESEGVRRGADAMPGGNGAAASAPSGATTSGDSQQMSRKKPRHE